MLKLVVVEDEVWMREALRTVIDWNAIGIEYVGEAQDGAEALELIESVRPDIVMADIQMPFMDGITLMEELNRRSIRTNVIIISAFRDFEYARKTMKLGAVDYITKPIYEDQLLEAIERLREKIHKESEKSQYLEMLSGSFRESLPLARQKLLENILTNDNMTISDPVKTLEALVIELNPKQIGAISILVYEWGEKGDDEISRSLIRYAIGNITEEVLNGQWKVAACPLNGAEIDTLALISPLGGIESESDKATLQNKCKEVMGFIEQYLDIQVSIGLSRFDSITMLKQSCIKALNAASLNFYEEAGRIYDIDEVIHPEENEEIYLFPSSEWRKSMLLALRTRDEESVSQMADSLMSHVASLRDTHSPLLVAGQIRIELFQLLDSWMHEAQLGENGQAVFYRIKSSWAATRPTLMQIKPRLLEALALLNDRKNPQGTHKRLIDQALVYIRSRYKEGVTLNDAAEHLLISPWHFSKTFHEVIGITFSNYIIQLRMNEAKELLKQTHLKVYEIAEAVGYKDARYFVKTFKDVEGLTPSQFRNNQD